MNTLEVGKQTRPKIEMPPVDQINAVTQSLANDTMPLVQQEQQYYTQAQAHEDYPTVSMDNLPTYESDYNPQAVEAPEVEQPVQQSIQQPQHQAEESSQARNFREMRMQMAQRDREIEELRQKLAQQLQQQAIQKQEDDEPDLNFDPEDLASGKHLNVMAQELKSLKKELRQTRAQSEEAKKQAYKADVEQQLRRAYPDFDAVLSANNVEKFAQQYGALAKSIASDPDYFNQCSAAYMAIKNTGIAAQPQIEKIKQNAAKPRPLTSIAPQQAESPLARVNAFSEGLTPELTKALQAEMNAARRRI